jgi:hypothetical protein
MTPKQYILKRINNGEPKGNIRIWVVNMLRESYLQSDKDFYTQALKELDLI